MVVLDLAVFELITEDGRYLESGLVLTALAY